MAFESLTDKLQDVFKDLRSKGRLTEADVKVALKEVKMALLEADVKLQGCQAVRQVCGRTGDRSGRHERIKSRSDGHQDRKRRDDFPDGFRDTGITVPARQSDNRDYDVRSAGCPGKTTTTAKLAGKFKLKAKSHCL